MKYLMTITAALLTLTACARLPDILMPSPSDQLPSLSQCREMFPRGSWQIHHAIEATVPGGGKTLLTGVTVVSAPERSIKFALMSVEGFVIFSGRFDGQLTVDRAVSPFDRPGFAQGLMDDLALLFFPPQGPLSLTGKVGGQDLACRYCLPDKITDIIVSATDRQWQIRQYNARKRLARSISAADITQTAGSTFARKLTLKNHGLLGYELVLTLLEAIPLNSERNPQQ